MLDHRWCPTWKAPNFHQTWQKLMGLIVKREIAIKRTCSYLLCLHISFPRGNFLWIKTLSNHAWSRSRSYVWARSLYWLRDLLQENCCVIFHLPWYCERHWSFRRQCLVLYAERHQLEYSRYWWPVPCVLSWSSERFYPMQTPHDVIDDNLTCAEFQHHHPHCRLLTVWFEAERLSNVLIEMIPKKQ